ncbi:MAG: META domain-containing protein [Parafilimonas sp.]
MKQLILAGIFLSVIICKSNIESAAVTHYSSYKQEMHDTTGLAGSWKLLPVLASDTAAGKIPQINFDVRTNRFSGNTGCNIMGGIFSCKQDALSFSRNIISTKMACPGYNEKAFLDNLLKTNRYEIKNGVMQLMYNATVLSKWVRHIDTTPTKHI